MGSLAPTVIVQEKQTTTRIETKGSEKSCCHGTKKLSVYESPHPNIEYELEMVQPGTLEQYVRTARKAVSEYLVSFQGVNERVSTFISTGVEHTKSSYEYLTDDASTVPRVIAITVGGFSGLVLATRRGFFRKMLYGGSGALIVAAVCYPKQASEISKNAFYKMKTDGFDFVQQYTGYNPKDLTEKLPELPSTASFSSILEMFNQQIKSAEKPEIPGDQSHPEDKHMYTTRSN